MKKCMHKIENMPLQTSSIVSRPWQMSQSACFFSKILCAVVFWQETACVSKARGWQMPGPGTAQNLQMPNPRDWQGGQLNAPQQPGRRLGAVGIDWCINHTKKNVFGIPTEIPTLPFWPKTSRFRQIFPVSSYLCLTSIFSTILCRFSEVSQPFLPLGHPSTSLR